MTFEPFQPPCWNCAIGEEWKVPKWAKGGMHQKRLRTTALALSNGELWPYPKGVLFCLHLNTIGWSDHVTSTIRRDNLLVFKSLWLGFRITASGLWSRFSAVVPNLFWHIPPLAHFRNFYSSPITQFKQGLLKRFKRHFCDVSVIGWSTV